MRPDTQTKQQLPFALNKTLLTDFGLNLSSDEKLYHTLASPFENGISIPHPLCSKIPEGFLVYDFSFDKVSDKLTDQALIYSFYNIMDQRIQVLSAQTLMGKNMKYHKSEKVWVRKKENRFQYFNIIEWQYMDFSGNLTNDNFATYDDFTER